MASPRAPVAQRGRTHREAIDRPLAAALALDAEHVHAINVSHERCTALGLSRIERPDLGLIDRAELTIVRERNQRLHAQAAPVMELLYDQIVNTHSMVVLTDSAGTIVHAIGDDDFLQRASRVALQPGAVWSEAQKGTNAVGTALMTEVPTLVHADEHFFHANQFLTCSAAPILDPRGNLLGVLDVSGDHRSYHQHTMALVKMSARMIENHWLSDDYRSVMRLHFHSRIDFIGTLMEGIIAIKPDGRIVGANRGALEQLGLSGAALRMASLESLFGTSVGALVDRFRSPLSTPLAVQASIGRRVYLHARFDWPVWTSLAEAVASQVPQVLPMAVEVTGAPARATPATLPRPPEDAAVAEALAHVQLAMQRDMPIVLVGETGCGKEWLARAAHDAVRPAQPFALLDCANLAPEAFDALIGGHGARVQRAGTLCLDEIGELPLATQARLLLWLDRSGATRAGVACTSRDDLRALVTAGRFRADLYHRLNGLAVHVPALCKRSDVIELARRIVGDESPDAPPLLSAEVVDVLRRHRWPGNVRQLGNVMRAALVLAAGAGVISRAHLPADFVDEAAAVGAADAGVPQSLQAMEREVIRHAVEAAQGNISEASKRLGISRNTVYRKLRWNERH